MTLYLFT